MTTPTQVPKSLVIGDTWEWRRTLADYPASEWTAAWHFEKADASFTVTGTNDGGDHLATVPVTTSAGYKVGSYHWRLVVSKTEGSPAVTTRKSLEEGWTDLEHDPAAAGNYDHRTPARVMLDNVDAYLADPANLTAASFSYKGRQLSRWDRKDLIAERSMLRAEVQRQEGMPRRLYARFNRA